MSAQFFAVTRPKMCEDDDIEDDVYGGTHVAVVKGTYHENWEDLDEEDSTWAPYREDLGEWMFTVDGNLAELTKAGWRRVGPWQDHGLDTWAMVEPTDAKETTQAPLTDIDKTDDRALAAGNHRLTDSPPDVNLLA
jgi:hypothetical protein